jgi:hypothetical protein
MPVRAVSLVIPGAPEPRPGRRRLLLAAGAALVAPLARAHHGWSSFDQSRPIYLAGTVRVVRWANPHAEIELEPVADLKLPGDLPKRAVPPQQAPVDAPAVLAATTLPRRRERVWTVELAPLTRMQAWGVEPLRIGETVEVVGFTFRDERGDAVVRAEYLFRGGKAYGLRSSPA